MNESWFTMRGQCPVCSSAHYSVIYRCAYDSDPLRAYLDHTFGKWGREVAACVRSADYVLCECAECGLLFQKEIPNERLMTKVYEEWRDIGDVCEPHDNLGYHCRQAQEIMQVIAFFQSSPSRLSFLDFGMGRGEWAQLAKGFGCQCYGTELSESLAQQARSNGIEVVQAGNLPCQCFDLVNAEQVFEHLAEPEQVLQQLKKSLKPTGLVKIGVPDALDMKRRLSTPDWSAPKGSRNSLNPVAPLEHINCFRRRSLALLARQAGMEVVRMPVRLQYRFVTDWDGVKRSLKNIILPFYRNTIQNYVFLRSI